jgi:glycosyltransferase involved in cell wall biosynthesis
MGGFSVVIICKNEADIISGTLKSLQGVTDDIIVYDNGSTDGTQELVKKFNVHLFEGPWEGFGKTKKKAASLARYDWILSLDADEAIDEELKRSLLALELRDEKTVFLMNFKNFLGKQLLKYGEWGGDKHIRLYNRQIAEWDDAPVHEQLILPPEIIVKKIKGYVLHRTMKDIKDYSEKMIKYAILNAEKYQQQGKKASWFRTHLSARFSFLNYYFFRLGFLDGHAGYVCARMTAYYTFLKYERLRELNRKSALSSSQSGQTP